MRVPGFAAYEVPCYPTQASEMAAPPPHRPRSVRWINRLGSVLAPRWPSLDPDDIVETAARNAGSERSGDYDFLPALARIVDAVEREAGLHWIGRVAVRRMLLGHLEALFGVYRYRAEHPEIVGVPIEKPVFIVGFPRSGTTILFNLLAQDPANRAPLSWEAQFPYPAPRAETFDTDARIAKTQELFDQSLRLVPNMPAIHEVGALLPQECFPIMAQTMLTPWAWWTYNVPSYQDWVDQQSAAPAYRYHRHFLEHLQHHTMKDRWVLKSPIHLRTLDSLLDEYPDARLIFTHRDPAKTIPSVASLFYTIGGIVTDRIDPRRQGRAHLDWWGDALDSAMDVRARHPDKAGQFVDIQFEEVIADPVAALRRAYEQLGMPWSDVAERRMQGYIERNPRGKHGAHTYTLDDFGLELEQVRERFDRYCRTFDVPLVPSLR